jgi:hypothetical protein
MEELTRMNAAGDEKPLPGEIAEALRHPNGWVYRIAGAFSKDQDIPPEAIVGAWRVDGRGEIVGSFLSNDRYDAKQWPAG